MGVVILLSLPLFLIYAQNDPVTVLLQEDSIVAAVDYTINNTSSGFEATFTITNTGTETIIYWGLEFDWDRTISSIWDAEIVSVVGGHYKITNVGWNANIAPGESVSFSCIGTPDTNSVPANIVVTCNNLEIPPDVPCDELAIVYETISEDSSSFSGLALLANPNAEYAWNGNFFAVRSVQFLTTSEIIKIESTNGPVDHVQTGNIVNIYLGWQSMFPLGSSLYLIIEGSKQGGQVYPAEFSVHYVRSEEIRYPFYDTLPESWYKGKEDLTSADLIIDPLVYYSDTPQPINEYLIIYEPNNTTQIQIGQVDSMSYPVNTVDGVRIWVPTQLMAMGIGMVYEFFKINPNYMCALGTKENFAAGVVRENVGSASNPVIIDGEIWYWPIIAHPDGPYQQETGNFNDCKSFFPDFFPDNAVHDDYTAITVDFTNPNWISSGISSAISISVTREMLNAFNIDYNGFMDNAVDPWAEFSIITYAYNRGINDFLTKKLFTDNRALALASPNIAEEFGMGGFANHVPTVRAITDEMNKALYDIYDAQISREDMEIFFARLRMFYARGVPSDPEWNAMVQDIFRAFDVLAEHWQGNYISFRYDYLTLLRIIREYLPVPHNPRPTGQDWYYQVINADPGTGIAEGRVNTDILANQTIKVYPNPVRGGLASAAFSLPEQQQITLTIYDITGRQVMVAAEGIMSEGINQVSINTSNLTTGIYFARLTSGDISATTRMVIIR